MASSISLNSSVTWVKPFIFFKPMAFGAASEPAVSSANLVEQTIVGAPFRWNWNRAVKMFTCVQQGNPPAFVQDNIVQMSDFGFIEKAVVYSPDGSLKELEIRNGLSEDTVTGRPQYISAQIDDNGTLVIANITNVELQSNVLTITANNSFSTGQIIYFSGLNKATFLNGNTAIIINANGASFTAIFNQAILSQPNYASSADTGIASTGNITFRLMPVPDQAYKITVTYQKKVPLMTSLSNFWTVPDQYSYIFQYGFMALMMQFSDDPRWQVYNAKFVTHLLGASQGLNDMERNIFMQSWQAITGFPQSRTIELQQGWQARGNS
jgi:hypothetical protein